MEVPAAADVEIDDSESLVVSTWYGRDQGFVRLLLLTTAGLQLYGRLAAAGNSDRRPRQETRA